MTEPKHSRIAEWTDILSGITGMGGKDERTKIIPNLLVVDDSPADLPAGYVIVEDIGGYKKPAVVVSGLVVNTNDLVNVLYIEGTEPIVMQQGSASPTVPAGWPYDDVFTVDLTNTGADYASVATAVAALTEGQTAFLGSVAASSYTEGLIEMGDDYTSLIGIDKLNAYLVTSGSDDSIQVDYGTYFANLKIRNSASVATTLAGFVTNPLEGGCEVDIEHVTLVVSNTGAGDAHGVTLVYRDDYELIDCNFRVNINSGDGYAAYLEEGAELYVQSGFLLGETAAIYAEVDAEVQFRGMPTLQGGIDGPGTFSGAWQDERGYVHAVPTYSDAAPAVPLNGMIWLDTNSDPIELNIRNTTNDGWHTFTAGGSALSNVTVAPAPDGVTALFTVTGGEYEADSLIVTVNGQVQTAGIDFVETAPAAGTFTFQAGSIPETDDIIRVFIGLNPGAGGIAAVGANPTGTVGLSVVNGVLTTFMRSDAAPPLSQSIEPTWDHDHIWSDGSVTMTVDVSEQQVLFPGTGSGAGLVIGGDTQWYRSAADILRTPDTVVIDTALGIGISPSPYHLYVYGDSGPTQVIIDCTDSSGSAIHNVMNDADKGVSVRTFGSAYGGSFHGIPTSDLGTIAFTNDNAFIYTAPAAPLYLGTYETIRLGIASTGAITFNTAYTFPTADGAASEVLVTDGAGALTWEPHYTNPMTTQGDIIYGGAAGVATRLAGSGTDEYVLTYDTGTGAPTWADIQTRTLTWTAQHIFTNQNVGIAVSDPDTQLEIFNAGDQLKLSFDAADNAVFAVDTNGDLTITPSGTSIIAPCKIAFTQADLNEYIDSLADGYLDIYATTAIRMESAQMSLSGTGALRLGPDTTYEAFYADAGDIYSESGKMYMGSGIQTVAERYGVGLQVRETALTKTLVYDIDATFTAATATILKAGETFVTDGVVVGDFLIIASANDTSYIGSTGEVVGLTETTIIVSIAAAGDAIPADLTSVDFVVYNHPVAAILDNGDIHFLVGVSQDASFKVLSPTGKNVHSAHFDITAGVAGHHGIGIDFDAHTYGGCVAERINYDATAFVAGITGVGLDFVLLNTGATGGDLHAIDVALSDPTNTDMENAAVATHTGVDVIHQHLGTQAAIAAAFTYDDSAATYTDVTAAFAAAGVDVQLFAEDDDQVLIASAAKFDQVNVLLEILASVTVSPTFHFIEDDGDWIAYTPSDDTNGFQQNGSIRWDSDSLATWGQRTVNEVTGEAGAVDYYWIKITRTRNIVATPPTEDTVKVTVTGTFHEWDSAGRLAIKTYNQAGEPDTTDLPASKFCFWSDTDDSKLYLCYNHGGTIKTVEMT